MVAGFRWFWGRHGLELVLSRRIGSFRLAFSFRHNPEHRLTRAIKRLEKPFPKRGGVPDLKVFEAAEHDDFPIGSGHGNQTVVSGISLRQASRSWVFSPCKFSASAPEIEAHCARRNRQTDAEFSGDPFRPAGADGASIKDP